jgi:hypothetical protein
MRLAGIKPGDIVRVHDGLPYLAEVIGHDGPGCAWRKVRPRGLNPTG